MSLISLASGASAWRGYEYYLDKNVLIYERINENEYIAKVKGNGRNYDVHIDTKHPRKSKCNCPHADGRRIICKHMIATYFTAFPDEAKAYIEEIEEYVMEEERREQEKDEKLERYINSLSKQELKELLYDVLCECPEWIVESFVYDRMEW